MDYCAVCGAEGKWAFHVFLDDQVVDFCDEHGIPGWGIPVCAEPVLDGLGCALPKGHEGEHRRVYRDLCPT